MTFITWIETGLFGAKQRPLGCFGHVVERTKRRTGAFKLADETMELLVIDECPPLVVDAKFNVRQQQTHGMLVLARHLILVGNVSLQACDELDDLVVPRHVLHCQRARVRLATIGDTFDLDEIGLAEVYEIGVLLHVFGVPTFDER